MIQRISMALLALASGAFQVYAQSNMTVSGKIEGIPSGQLVLVAQVGENQVDTLGAASFKAPKFQLKAMVKEPVMAQLVVKGYGGGFNFIAEPNAKYQAFLCNDNRAYVKEALCKMSGRLSPSARLSCMSKPRQCKSVTML